MKWKDAMSGFSNWWNGHPEKDARELLSPETRDSYHYINNQLTILQAQAERIKRDIDSGQLSSRSSDR